MTIHHRIIQKWAPWVFLFLVILGRSVCYSFVLLPLPPISPVSSHNDNDKASHNHHRRHPAQILRQTRQAAPIPRSRRPLTPNPRRQPSRERDKNNFLTVSEKTQLVRVIDSIVFYSQNNNNNNNNPKEEQSEAIMPSKQVIQVLNSLRSARTSMQQLQQAGQGLTMLDLVEQEPWPIQERLLKVMALAGLVESATTLLRRMLRSYSTNNTIAAVAAAEEGSANFPSYISYTAVLSALRKKGDIDTLRDLLQELAHAAQCRSGTGTNQESIHIMALNLFLAALCDDPYYYCDDTANTTTTHGTTCSTSTYLEEASQYILHPEKALQDFGIPALDLASYNTVLNGAARAGNQTLVDAIWNGLLKNVSIRPDIRSYNARLSATTSYAERLKIWEELLPSNDRRGRQKRNWLTPDRYTINLILLPIIQQQQQLMQLQLQNETQSKNTKEDQLLLEPILDVFVARHSEAIVRDAFSAFLNTLVQNGKLNVARRLFEIYIVPCLKQNGNPLDELLLESSQRPDTRHFNILIDGYRKEAMNAAIAAASSAVAGNQVDDIQPTTSAMIQQELGETPEDYKTRLLWQAKNFTLQGEAARKEGRKLFRQMKKAGILPDAYTLTSVMGLCDSAEEVVLLLVNPLYQRYLSAAVIRAAITATGQLGDPGLACVIFDQYQSQPKISEPNNPRLLNVLLNALSLCAEKDNPTIQIESIATGLFHQRLTEGTRIAKEDSMTMLLQGKSCTDAIRKVLTLMSISSSTIQDDNGDTFRNTLALPPPNGQTYCVAAAALQYSPGAGPELAMELFRNATTLGIPADGRFVNAVFRCFGDDINQALASWKSEIRQACLKCESQCSTTTSNSNTSSRRPSSKNMIAAYNGLLHICGRARRPDIGVRIVYAMNREGIEPNEVSLNNYRAGKRLRNRLDFAPNLHPSSSSQRRMSSFIGGVTGPQLLSMLPKLNMMQQYENILYVECTKYNLYDKRMSKDTRVRIIV